MIVAAGLNLVEARVDSRAGRQPVVVVVVVRRRAVGKYRQS